jgi:hypothetical protein
MRYQPGLKWGHGVGAYGPENSGLCSHYLPKNATMQPCLPVLAPQLRRLLEMDHCSQAEKV